MRMMTKILGGAAGLAGLAAAAPAAAQYAYGYNPYAYSPYSANVTALATQQCTAAVQNRLYTRSGLSGVIGSLIGVSGATPRVLSITQVVPRQNRVVVRGLASSGRFAAGPFGVGAYGALGYGMQPDLSFRCSVDYRGYVRDVDINRRF